jgi:hypothetical protein
MADSDSGPDPAVVGEEPAGVVKPLPPVAPVAGVLEPAGNEDAAPGDETPPEGDEPPGETVPPWPLVKAVVPGEPPPAAADVPPVGGLLAVPPVDWAAEPPFVEPGTTVAEATGAEVAPWLEGAGFEVAGLEGVGLVPDTSEAAVSVAEDKGC